MKFFNLCYFLFFSANVCFVQINSIGKTIVVGQFDKSEDRFSIEINTSEILSTFNIKAIPSLNLLKIGSDASLLSTDSIQKQQADLGYNTFMIINVRGYDRRYKKSSRAPLLKDILASGNLFKVYREEATSVSFEISLYKNGKLYFRDIIKCGNISDRSSVIKRYRKKLSKRIHRKWRKKLKF